MRKYLRDGREEVGRGRREGGRVEGREEKNGREGGLQRACAASSCWPCVHRRPHNPQ